MWRFNLPFLFSIVINDRSETIYITYVGILTETLYPYGDKKFMLINVPVYRIIIWVIIRYGPESRAI